MRIGRQLRDARGLPSDMVWPSAIDQPYAEVAFATTRTRLRQSKGMAGGQRGNEAMHRPLPHSMNGSDLSIGRATLAETLSPATHRAALALCRASSEPTERSVVCRDERDGGGEGAHHGVEAR